MQQGNKFERNYAKSKKKPREPYLKKGTASNPAAENPNRRRGGVKICNEDPAEQGTLKLCF